MNIAALRKAISNASIDAAVFMTHQVRQTAVQHGWDPEVVAGLRVEHSGDKFSVKAHPDVADRAFVHEFGDEATLPTAAVRKYANQIGNTGTFLAKSISYHYGKESK